MQLPDQGVCSVEGEIRVTILSFGMGRVSLSYASGLHGPLPGFCSVTIDQEGRAYVYICQDDDVHWMHMLEARLYKLHVVSYFLTFFSDRTLTVQRYCRSLLGHLTAFRSINNKIIMILSYLVTLQWIVRNSSIEIPSEDLFGFHRARQKYLVPLTTQVSLESDDFVDHDFYPPSERDLDFGMCVIFLASSLCDCEYLSHNAKTGRFLTSKMKRLRQI